MVTQWYQPVLSVGPHALPKTQANMAGNNPSMILMLEKVETNGPQTSQTTIYNDGLLAATNSSSPAMPPVTKCSKKAWAIGNSPPTGNLYIDLPVVQNPGAHPCNL